jgi:hypothetical protein
MPLSTSAEALFSHHDDGGEIVIEAFGRRLVLEHDRDTGRMAIVGDREAPDRLGIAVELRPKAHKGVPGDQSEPLPVRFAVANGARDPPRLHDFAQACAALRCSRQTIYRLVASDDLRLIKIRGKSLVAGVDELIASQLAAGS